MNVFFQLKKATVSRRLLKGALCILFFACICGYASASPSSPTAPGIKITGTVVDKTGEPVIMANILEKGTVNGTVTDIDGHFAIEVAGTESVLVVSYLGYVSQEVKVGDQITLKIVLEENVSLLDEVVVIGYGTQKKADVTSSISSIKADDFNKGAILDAGQLVQGKVAGLQISLPTGDPTATTSVVLRGFSSLMGTSNPLILVDGVPGSFGTVAPEEIASIDVLKDGSATAIYGTRGTNGVIIITTKGLGKEAKPTIEYSGYVSASQWVNSPDFLTASDLRARLDEGWTFSGANDKDYGTSTNWLKEINQTALTHVSNLTYKGGNDKTGFLANVTYDWKEGAIKTSGARNIRARVQVNHSIFEDKLSTNFALYANETNTDMDNNWDYIYRLACIQNPTQAIYDENGDYVERDVYNYDNPISYLNERIGMTRARNLRATGIVEFKPVESLTFKAMYTRKGQGLIAGSYYTKKDVTTTSGGYNGYASRYSSDMVYDMSELSAAWNKTIAARHHFSAIAGYNYESTTSEYFGLSNKDFPSDAYTYNSLGRGNGLTDGTADMYSGKTNNRIIGLFARATYNFDDRYLLMASFRHEGSTKFGASSKWGNFPGVSLGWRINNESFMKDITWIDNLKLRAGFGITGIDANPLNESLAALDFSEPYYYNNEWRQALIPKRNANVNLRWEKKYEYNLGIDFDLFNSRIGGAIDLYQRDTKDGLYNYSVPTPPYQYSTILANVCQIRNRGIEIMINAVPVQTRDFQWNTSITYSANKNELLSLQNDEFKLSSDFFYSGYTGEPIQTSTHIVKEGWAVGNFYGLKSVGLNPAGKWLVERYNFNEEGKPVSIFYDLAENATSDDWKILGNGVPKYFLNWNNNFKYKNWDMAISMRGAFGFQILNYQKMYYGNPTIQYNVLNCAFDKLAIVDPKTGEGTGETAVISDSQRYLSYYIEDGDYWKIDNITLGYTFNTSNINIIQNLRVYCSVRNLATITGYTGLDPEVRMTYGSNGYDPGTDDRDKYPTTRSFTFGVNMTF